MGVVRRYIDFLIIIITYLYSTCITVSSDNFATLEILRFRESVHKS